MGEFVHHMWDVFCDLPQLLIYFVLFIFVPISGWIAISLARPDKPNPLLGEMISWLLDNYHKIFPAVFVVFATTDLLSRPGLTVEIDGIVVPVNPMKLTIELLDRAKIGVAIYIFLLGLSSLYAKIPSRLTPHPDPSQRISQKLDEKLANAAHFIAEIVAGSLSGPLGRLNQLIDKLEAAHATACDANGDDNVTPIKPARRDGG